MRTAGSVLPCDCWDIRVQMLNGIVSCLKVDGSLMKPMPSVCASSIEVSAYALFMDFFSPGLFLRIFSTRYQKKNLIIWYVSL